MVKLKPFWACLWPRPVCQLCGAKTTANAAIPGLCHGCFQDLPNSEFRCRQCAMPLMDQHSALCGACLRAPPPYRHTFTFANYGPPLSGLIQQFKFNQKLGFARLLGNLVGHNCLMKKAEFPEVIIPVPLHRQRLRQRGYNQAQEMAKITSEYLYQQTGIKIAIDHQSCHRQQLTLEQSGLSRLARQSNLKGAFVVKPLSYNHVVIYDDVMTTGTTVSELARACLAQGAQTVDVWVCARAVVSH